MLQCDLSALQEWSDTWLLKFHPDKCEVLSIGKDKRPAYPYHLETDGKHHPLKHVEQLKDLGIIMSTNLDFDKHISEKVNKANSMMGLIRRTFNFIDEENFMLLYKAFVRPHLEYGNAVWSPHKVEYIGASFHRGLPRTTADYRGLPRTGATFHCGLPRTTVDYRGLVPLFTVDYRGLPRTTVDYRRLPRTGSTFHCGLPRTTADYRGLPRTTPDYPGLVPLFTVDYRGLFLPLSLSS